jgi:hypothetical protein
MTTTTKKPRPKKPTKKQMELVNSIRNLGYALYYHVERGNRDEVDSKLAELRVLESELSATYPAAKS